MADKKYVGSGFTGKYENSQNIDISIPKLAAALGIDLNKLKACFLPLYDKEKKAFSTPAIYVSKFTTKDGTAVEELCIKIQTNARQGDVKRLNVTLNEFVKDPNYKAEPKQAYSAPAPIEEPGAEFDMPTHEPDDLPFWHTR